MVLAIVADALQIVVFPLFVEGAPSPADDILDFAYWQPCWSTFLAGTGNFCPRFLASSYPESIWFLSGRWRLQTSIVSRSGLRLLPKKVASGTRY
jgi:hypothetical protein